jgi:NAD(P)H-dependent flavin oxidoreductase YrpB (nitropropane dioxygenase family)
VSIETALTRLVGIRHPVVQTGMGWVSGARLTAATAEAGGLGILGSATMTYEQLHTAIKETKARTAQPFGVNIRADAQDAAQRIELLIKEKVRLASFALAPKREMIARLKDAGVVVMPTVGAVRHAEKAAAWGADAVIVQGGEAGGHTGSVATTVLLPSVVDSVDIPVIAAGGFFDGRGLVAALAYGAHGIAMGTRFLLTKESTVPDAVKQAYLESTDTVVTTRVDGRPHRVLSTDLITRLEGNRATALIKAIGHARRFRKLTGLSIPAMVREGLAMKHERSWAQVIMAANTPMLLRAGLVEGRTDTGVFASGQVVGLLNDLPTVHAVITKTIEQAEQILNDLRP